MRIVLLGPPGAGKGTLANLLKEALNVLHISSGDILREELKNKTPLGLEVKGYLDNGQLVPDDVITKLIDNKLNNDPRINRGFLLDGFPRTQKQAKDLDEILGKLHKPLDYTFYFETTLPVVIKRLTGRRVCRQCGALYHIFNRPSKKESVCDQCGGELYQRSDDNEQTIRTRMDVYLESTLPIINYYQDQGKLRKLDADRDSEELQARMMQIFHEDKKLHQP